MRSPIRMATASSSTRLEANKSDASNYAFLTNKCPKPFVLFVLTLRQGTKGQLSVTTPLVGVASRIFE